MEHHASKWKGLAWVAAACVAGVCFAFGIAPLAHAIPWNWEKNMAAVLGNDTGGGKCPADPRAEAALQRIVARLYPAEAGDKNFSIDVRVVKNKVVNAYAGLGGHIFINSGLLKQAESPEEVAGVLAHEIGHVQHRHIMEGAIAHFFTSAGINMMFGHSSAASWANLFLNMNFSRGQEAQADEAGLTRLEMAHIDNHGFIDFFKRMEKSGAAPEFLSDHPSNESRIEMAERFPDRNTTPVLMPPEWRILKNYCN